MSDIYYDTYNEGEAPEEENRAGKIVKIVLTSVFVTALLFVIGFFFYRMWEMKEPRGIGTFLWTAHSAEVRASSGGTAVRAPYDDGKLYAFEYEDLNVVHLTKKEGDKSSWQKIDLNRSEYYANEGFRVFTANTGSFTVKDSDGGETTVKCSGYLEDPSSPVDRALRVSDTYFVPAAGQVQLTFRYKSDVLKKLNGKAGEDGSVFLYALRDDKGTLYTSYTYKVAKRGVYRYITMVFENVDLSIADRLDLAVEYRTENGAARTLFLYVYDNRLPLPVYEVQVKTADVQTLPKFALAALLPQKHDSDSSLVKGTRHDT